MYIGQIRIHLFLKLLYIYAKLSVYRVCSLLPLVYCCGPTRVPFSMCTHFHVYPSLKESVHIEEWKLL